MHVIIVAICSTSGYPEEDSNTIVSKSVIIEEEFYLLKDPIHCNGRITSIDLYGFLINPDAMDDFTLVYFNVALYRPHQTNETESLERITGLVQLESSYYRSFATVQLDNGVTCARLRITEYN